MTAALVIVAVWLALSFLTSMIAHAQPPRIGYLGDLIGSLMVWACLFVVGGGAIYGLLALVHALRGAW